MTEDDTAGNGWWPVTTSSELAASDGFLPVRLFDQPWLIVRLDGSTTAVRDECPHRRVPLSSGQRVESPNGQRLECAYHGWQFAGTGSCVDIPALGLGAAVPAGMRVRTAQVAERHGVVWLATSDLLESSAPAEHAASEVGAPVRLPVERSIALRRLRARVGGDLSSDGLTLQIEFDAADGHGDRLVVLSQPESADSSRLYALWQEPAPSDYADARGRYWQAIAQRAVTADDDAP